MNDENIYSHRNGLVILQHALPDAYSQLLEILNFNEETDLRIRTEKHLTNSTTNKSSSDIYNKIIESRFLALNWLGQPRIFSDDSYDSWKLDFGKQNMAAVEVAFNNASYVPHILAKLEISCVELHRIKKDINAQEGILIVASEELKKSQNFDTTCVTFEGVIKFLHAYETMLTSPMVVFAIDAPKTFKIQGNKKQQDAQKNSGTPLKDLVDRAKVINL